MNIHCLSRSSRVKSDTYGPAIVLTKSQARPPHHSNPPGGLGGCVDSCRPTKQNSDNKSHQNIHCLNTRRRVNYIKICYYSFVRGCLGPPETEYGEDLMNRFFVNLSICRTRFISPNIYLLSIWGRRWERRSICWLIFKILIRDDQQLSKSPNNIV